MEAAVRGGGDKTSSSPKPFKFSAYQNPALSATLTANSLQPSNFTFLCIFSLSLASAFTLFRIISRENTFIDNLMFRNLPQEIAYFSAKFVQTMVGLVFLGTISAIFKAISLYRGRFSDGVSVLFNSKGTKDQINLSKRQLGFLGIKQKVDHTISEQAVKPPKSKLYPSSSPVEALVPIHPSINSLVHLKETER